MAAVGQILSQHLCVRVRVRRQLWHSAVQLQTAHLHAVPELGAHLGVILHSRTDIAAGGLGMLLRSLGGSPAARAVLQAAVGPATHAEATAAAAAEAAVGDGAAWRPR